MTVATASLTASIAEFIVNAAPPPRARERAAVAVCDTVGVVLAGASEAGAAHRSRGDHLRKPRQLPHPRHGRARQRERGGVRQRRRRPRARLRRHVLRLDGAPELRARAGGDCGRRTGRRLRPGRARRLHRRVRARMPPRHDDEPAPLPRARLALHVDHRHARRRGGGRADPEAVAGGGGCTRSASPRRSPAGSRKTSARW